MTANLKKIETGNNRANEGFTLVEVVIALVIFLIAVMGVFATFAYAVNYNAGNNSRTRALTVLQQEIELLRSAKFTPTIPDPTTTTNSIINAGTRTKTVKTQNEQYYYIVKTVIDDDPETPEVQVNKLTTLKEITITVTLDSPTPGWQTAVPVTVVMRRVRAN